MPTVKIANVCGLCAGCLNAINTAKDSLKTHKNVVLFKEIVHNKTVNDMLKNLGIKIKQNFLDLLPEDLVILRAHGEPPATYTALKQKQIEYIDCTCANVKKIHVEVQKYSQQGYTIILLGKYKSQHPEVVGTAGWCAGEIVFVEDENDLFKLSNLNNKCYLVCQTTFNTAKAEKLIEQIKKIVKGELIINKSICPAQQQINKSALDLAKTCDVMLVVGSKNSSNTVELFNNLSAVKHTVFLDDIFSYKQILAQNGVNLNKNITIGITAGASCLKEELQTLKALIEAEN